MQSAIRVQIKRRLIVSGRTDITFHRGGRSITGLVMLLLKDIGERKEIARRLRTD